MKRMEWFIKFAQKKTNKCWHENEHKKIVDLWREKVFSFWASLQKLKQWDNEKKNNKKMPFKFMTDGTFISPA